MSPRFVGRLGLADAVTAANAALGFLAVVAATVDPGLAARLVLLAAVADGLDGLVARVRGGTDAGEFLDSLADVVSFCVAPAAIVVALVVDAWSLAFATAEPTRLVVAVGVPALFVVTGVVRLALYTAHDASDDHTVGVQTTLAGTILAAAVLAGVSATVALAATTAFVYLMVAEVEYPDLLPRDALLMGVLQAAAILAPGVFGGLFPKALLAWALAYLLLAPRFYWR
jgi:CDP-diacylglycerol--serine O-phosphatidyltransferase